MIFLSSCSRWEFDILGFRLPIKGNPAILRFLPYSREYQFRSLADLISSTQTVVELAGLDLVWKKASRRYVISLEFLQCTNQPYTSSGPHVNKVICTHLIDNLRQRYTKFHFLHYSKLCQTHQSFACWNTANPKIKYKIQICSRNRPSDEIVGSRTSTRKEWKYVFVAIDLWNYPTTSP